MKNNFFKNKNILVTGASGSIGSEIVRKLLKINCRVVRAMSNDENGIYNLISSIEKDKIISFNNSMKKNKIRYLIGDVRDFKRNLEASKNIDIVIHAAAMKHVPICEYNFDETHKTNFYGTKMLINASIKNKVKNFLFISTDKAAKPTSIMGKSKLRAEELILKSNINQKHTKLSVIRFGNVIGSRGSVLLKFLDQIKNKENLTITHKNATRFFITINQATDEILNSLRIMHGKELFIINDMSAFKIIDLAHALKKIFNYKKKNKIIGLREGEKVYEELFTKKDLKNIYFLGTKKNFSAIYKNGYRSDKVKNLNINQIIKFIKRDFKFKDKI